MDLLRSHVKCLLPKFLTSFFSPPANTDGAECLNTSPTHSASATTRTIGKLHHRFKRLKKWGQDGVAIDHMLRHFKIPVTDLSRAVFCVDKDHSLPSTVIDFRAFVLCIWNLCTQPHDLMANYFLDLLGKPVEDVSSLCMEIWGERLKLEPELMAICRDLLTSEHSRKMTPSIFSHLCESCPALLQPLLGMQRKWRNEILGSRAWEDLTNRRTALNYSVFVFKRHDEVIAKFIPKATRSMTVTDRMISGRNAVELNDFMGHTPQVAMFSVDDTSPMGENVPDWKPRPIYPDCSLSPSKSYDESVYGLTQPDIKLRSGESFSSSAAAHSDVSSLTNSTLNSSYSNEFIAPSPGSLKSLLVQISRHVRRHSDTSAIISVAKATDVMEVLSGVNSGDQLLSSISPSSNQKYPAVSLGTPPSLSPKHLAAQRQRSNGGATSKPSSSVSKIDKAKIFPIDIDPLSSSTDDEDTINGAMGWTKMSQRPRRRKSSLQCCRHVPV